MAKLIELTVAFDSTNPTLTELNPVKVLIDIDSIQAVTMREKGSRFCTVSLVPSMPAYSESEAGETMTQDQRTLAVLEPYHEIRSVLDNHRGIVVCTPLPK